MVLKQRKHKSVIKKKTKGFSLVEVIVIIAIVGFLFTLVARQARPPHVTVYANALAAVIQQGRYESVELNKGVAVVHVANKGFQVRTLSTNNGACTGTGSEVLRSLNFEGHGSVNVSMNQAGIIWFPNGLVLACDGSQASVSINIFDTSGKTRVLSINSIGRVEIE